MTFFEYCQLAYRTCSVLPLETHLLHMRSGIITELSELIDVYKKKIAYGKTIDTVNIKEEIGDILWYCGSWYYYYLTNVIKIHPNSLVIPVWHDIEKNFKTDEEVLIYLIHVLNTFTSYIDSYCKVGLSMETERRAYEYMVQAVCLLSTYFGHSTEDVAKTNIAKLQARYPDKFNSDKAINRDLDAERRILEQ